MNRRERLLDLFLLYQRLVYLAYARLYYWLFLKPFSGGRVDLIGKSSIAIHPSTRLMMRDSKIAVEDGVFTVGFDPLRLSEGRCHLRLEHSTLRIAGKVLLKPGVNIWAANATVVIGEGTTINGPASIFARAKVEIGTHCLIAKNTMIMDCDAHRHALAGEKLEDIPMQVMVGDHCWIGHDVTILKGVVVGEGSIVAAHSVVTKDVEPRTMVAGVPAKKIREDVIWEP